MALKLTDEDRAAARFLIDMATLFMDIRDTMPVRAVRAFGLVGLKPGLTVQGYAWEAKEAPGTMSRTLLDMGPRNRWGQSGGLLIDSANLERNYKNHHLTEAGLELLHKIATLRSQTRDGK